MKSLQILTLTSILFNLKAYATCFSEKLGYPCCSIGYATVITDNDGLWSVENDDWCGVTDHETAEKCWSASLGYPCCENTTSVAVSDESGDWGVEQDQWCGIIEPTESDVEQTESDVEPTQTLAELEPTETSSSNETPNDDVSSDIEIPKEGYMSQLKVEQTCPPQAKAFRGIMYAQPEKVTYFSNTTHTERQMNIILPPDYSKEKKYPVLYYLHDLLSDENGLLEKSIGTLEIYSNLVNLGKAKDMIIVLPNCIVPADGAKIEPGNSEEYNAAYDNFINELLQDVMPFIESNYSVDSGRENTAIAGFGQGGRSSLYIGYKHPELFGYLGAFSPTQGLLPYNKEQGLMKPEELQVEDAELQPIVTMITVGAKDTEAQESAKLYHETLASNEQPHIWFTVPDALHDSDACSASYYNFISTLWKILDDPKPTGTANDPSGTWGNPDETFVLPEDKPDFGKFPDYNAPYEKELPKEGYMSKLEVVDLCPSEIKVRREGVAYGEAEKITYFSTTAQMDRKMNVILPAGYTEDKKYPVLYYLHGLSGNEDSLLAKERATIEIYGNLVSEGKAKEMIIVLPDCYVPLDGVFDRPQFSPEYLKAYDNFLYELIDDVMPYIESHYSVALGRENTALAGFSQGGRNTIYIGYKHPELFGYLGAFSPAQGIFPCYDIMAGHQPGLMKPEELQADAEVQPIVSMITVGTKDFAVQKNPKLYHEALATNGQPHIWFTVPGALHDDLACTTGYYNFLSTLWGVLDQ